MLPIEERHTVERDRRVHAPAQAAQRPAAGNQIVLRDRFEPVDGGRAGEDLGVVLYAEPETKAQGGFCKRGV